MLDNLGSHDLSYPHPQTANASQWESSLKELQTMEVKFKHL